jgi:hypothetical protein
MPIEEVIRVLFVFDKIFCEGSFKYVLGFTKNLVHWHVLSYHYFKIVCYVSLHISMYTK